MKNKKKILIVFGTRPEAIKMATLVKEFLKYPDCFDIKVCVTAQHRQMLDQVLRLFDIEPDYDLDIMQSNQDLYDVTSRVLLGMREVLKDVKPDIVFVHGDTTTSMATSLAAYYQQIPVAHVEAGLRTGDIYSPFPEEINRLLTARLASYHFSPTTLSKSNLMHEGISEDKIKITGNTVIDALHLVVEKINTNPNISKELNCQLANFGYDTDRLDNRKMVLITGHRRENFGDGFLNICRAIRELAERYSEVDFVYPVHLNPNVLKPVSEILGGENQIENIFLLEPLDYLPFVYMMKHAYLLLTDSGGVQEEAPGLGKPVLVMRNSSERPEAIEAGTVKLVGTDKLKISCAVSELLDQPDLYSKMSMASNPYGDGKASKRIVDLFID